MRTLKQYIAEQFNTTNNRELVYEAPQKINNPWINQNSDSHEFNKGKGSIILKSDVTELDSDTFEGCGELISVQIPGSIVSISEETFQYCKNLKPVQIPSTVTKFGNYTLSNYHRNNVDLKEKYGVIKGDPTWDYMHNLYISFSLGELPQKRLLISPSNGLYDLHDDNTSTAKYTDEELTRLIKSISDYMQPGEILTAHGGLTPGGLSLIKRFTNHGFIKTGENKLSWSSKICRQYGMPDNESWMNQPKFIEWLKNPMHKNDCGIIDKNKPLDDENTYPIAWVLKKI